MKKKLFLFLVLSVMAALILAGCGGGNGGGGTAEEEGADIDTLNALQTIMENTGAALPEDVFFPMTLDVEITAENSENMLGLTPAQFEQHVMDSYTMIAAIGTFAFEVALVKSNSYADAAEVKNLIANGFDSHKWICVWPELSFVVESGRFVMLGAVPHDAAAALQENFSTYFSTNSGTVNTFFETTDEKRELEAEWRILNP